jgi:hypothetical protein
MIFCPQCGHPVVSDAQFCGGCGTPIPTAQPAQESKSLRVALAVSVVATLALGGGIAWFLLRDGEPSAAADGQDPSRSVVVAMTRERVGALELPGFDQPLDELIASGVVSDHEVLIAPISGTQTPGQPSVDDALVWLAFADRTSDRLFLICHDARVSEVPLTSAGFVGASPADLRPTDRARVTRIAIEDGTVRADWHFVDEDDQPTGVEVTSPIDWDGGSQVTAEAPEVTIPPISLEPFGITAPFHVAETDWWGGGVVSSMTFFPDGRVIQVTDSWNGCQVSATTVASASLVDQYTATLALRPLQLVTVCDDGVCIEPSFAYQAPWADDDGTINLHLRGTSATAYIPIGRGSYEFELGQFPGRWQAMFEAAGLVNLGLDVLLVPAVSSEWTFVDSTGGTFDSVTILGPIHEYQVLRGEAGCVDAVNSLTSMTASEFRSLGVTQSSSDICPEGVYLPPGVDPRACGPVLEAPTPESVTIWDWFDVYAFVIPGAGMICEMSDNAVNCDSTHEGWENRRLFPNTHPSADAALIGLIVTRQLTSNYTQEDRWGGQSLPDALPGDAFTLGDRSCLVGTDWVACWNGVTGHGFKITADAFMGW